MMMATRGGVPPEYQAYSPPPPQYPPTPPPYAEPQAQQRNTRGMPGMEITAADIGTADQAARSRWSDPRFAFAALLIGLYALSYVGDVRERNPMLEVSADSTLPIVLLWLFGDQAKGLANRFGGPK